MNNITIHPLRRRDSRHFLSLIDALADFEKLKRPAPAAKRRLIRDAFGPARRFDAVLVKADGIPAGYAITFETYSSFLAKPTLYLEDIFILPRYRSRGIGQKVFDYCLARARRRGCGRMEWVVLGWNSGAIRFYRRNRARYMHEWHVYRITL